MAWPSKNRETGVASYAHSAEAWTDYLPTLLRLIAACGARRICEVGGGANPALNPSDVRDAGIAYTVLDISPRELDKAPDGITKVAADICGVLPVGLGEFDLVFTRMLCEHVPDGGRFHRNVRRLLRNGGLAFHFFPTLFAPPFVVNRLMPERLASMLLDVVAPRDHQRHGKFPAYYSWCRGPAPRQIERLRALGYDVLRYRGYFGHGYYRRIPLLHAVSNRIANALIRHPVDSLTTYAYVVLRKVERDGEP